MKRFAILAVVAAATTIAVVSIGNRDVVDVQPRSSYALEYGKYRLAIAHEPCREPGESGYSYQSSKCGWWLTRGGYCGCMTHDDEPLSHELSQAEYDALPNSYFRDLGVCEGTIEGQFRRWMQYVVHYCDDDDQCPGESTCNLSNNRCVPAAGWSCALIKRKVPRVLRTYSAAETPIVLALRDVCCADCDPGEGCAVRPGSWGICPYCLLDGAGACDSLCITQ
jgi:hypothetical protein